MHKNVFIVLALTVASGFSTTVELVVEQAQNHRTIERVTATLQASGAQLLTTNRFIELETGMAYWDQNQWKTTEELIEIQLDGSAAATKGPHKVRFAANLNTAGSIDVQMPGNGEKRFRAHPFLIVYTDRASGESVIIGQLKNSIGQLSNPKTITYPDCMQGGVKANVIYSYEKYGIQQNVVIVEAPLAPAAYGLNNETTMLECWTEIVEMPEAGSEIHLHKVEPDANRRNLMAIPDITDQFLNFGPMQIPAGKAFLFPPDDDGEPGVSVFKTLLTVDGRSFLIESVEYEEIKPLVKDLAKVKKYDRARTIAKLTKSSGRTLTAGFPAKAKAIASLNRQRIQVASLAPVKGLNVDWTLVSSSSNMVFKGDETYKVNGSVTLTGTTVFEPNTVIKFRAVNQAATRLWLNGPLDCRTLPYGPAIITAYDDNTVGDPINPTNSVNGKYANRALDFNYAAVPFVLHDIHIRYAHRSLYISSGTLTISNITIVDSDYGIQGATGKTATWRNVLFYNVGTLFQTVTNTVEHITAYIAGTLQSGGGLYLTNSLLVQVTNISSTANWGNVETNSDGTTVFQTVGASACYLKEGSPYRGVGTTNISAETLAQIGFRTTYPPLTNAPYLNDTLWPHAPRGSLPPDLGYYPAPLDYLLSGVVLSNSSLTIHPGTVIGSSGDQNSFMVELKNGGSLSALGSPTNRIKFVRYNTVQEASATSLETTNGAATAFLTAAGTNASTASAVFEFCLFSMPAGGNWTGGKGYTHLDSRNANVAVTFKHNEIYGGYIYFEESNLNLLNNLYFRADAHIQARTVPMTFSMQNCTYYGGELVAENNAGGSWEFYSNIFDGPTLYQDGSITTDYNVYFNTTHYSPLGAADITNTVAIEYDTGPLGTFYLASVNGFTDEGNTAANLVGLYHFASLTNQVKETTSLVDFGYHYAALEADGTLPDYDGDGNPDVIENSSGTGGVASGETHWQSPSDLGFKVLITRPKSNSTIP